MLYNLYTYAHGNWDMCFWTLLSVLVAVIMVVMILGHTLNQWKRQKDFEKKMEHSQEES
ncbi:MAG: hypothetical protein K2N63_05975 [Lachnospiraceae bacterium]|nr:hypothetical protein [Lachnospiraceae bacterium]